MTDSRLRELEREGLTPELMRARHGLGECPIQGPRCDGEARNLRRRGGYATGKCCCLRCWNDQRVNFGRVRGRPCNNCPCVINPKEGLND
jgi:hypothetical protein